MKKSKLYRHLVLSIALLLPAHSVLCMNPIAPQTPTDEPLRVIVIGQPESALSKEVAALIKFIMDGIRSTWNRYCAIQDNESKLAQGSKTDKANAVLSAALRGVLLATPPLVGLLLLEGTKIGLEKIKRDIISPKLTVLNKTQKPVYGRINRLKNWYSGTKVQKMAFNAAIKEQLIEIEKKTLSLRNLIQQGKNRTYANLLLYGESGTGKTLFAQLLAEKTNMNFLPVTAASLLQAGVEGIKYFDEIITMANRSTYGTIIFVDEADALFIDRNTIGPSSEHYKVLNHILSIVDGRSNKFMVIAATNHAYLLDPAMGRRFQDRVLMPLPDAATRTALLNLYIPQILFNEKETSKQFVAAAQALCTPELIAEITECTAGLSHAEIADMIEAMRNKAELNKRSLTIKDIQSAFDAAIEKHKKNDSDRILREQRAEKK
jgi:AAA+ superfamily predicted ATPase